MEWYTGDISKEIYRLSLVLISFIVVVVLYKVLSRFLNKTGKRLELEPHAMNALRLLIRVGAIILTSYIILGVYEVPTSWFVGGSALIGAFLGFGSSQTINNIVAGFYVLITQPFKVKDYVKIGDLEGQVEEISINYTNLYTPTFNLLKIPNTQVMNSRILNITHEGFIKYTFTVGFDHNFTNLVLIDKVITPALDQFHEKYSEEQLRKPEAYLETINRLEQIFLVRIFIPKGEARRLYVMQPELLDLIMKNFNSLK